MKITKKNRRTSKPKIRWDLLGLSDPSLAESTTSIDTIRREVSLLASSGFGRETTIPSAAQDTKGRGRGRQPDGGRLKRRGATE
jgi:hypothetical protein